MQDPKSTQDGWLLNEAFSQESKLELKSYVCAWAQTPRQASLFWRTKAAIREKRWDVTKVVPWWTDTIHPDLIWPLKDDKH